ncbi:MAG: sugar phosphate isomerase/epimerase family protein [Candidatus Hydrothermarchaeales archaeon]
MGVKRGDKIVIGASSLAFLKYPAKDALERINAADFEAWEIILERGHAPRDFTKIKESVESYGLGIFAHAPFSDLNIASLNYKLREEAINQIFDAIKTGNFLGAELINIHSGRLSPMGMYFEDEVREINVQSVARIVEFARDFDMKVCLENAPNFFGSISSTIGEIKEIRDRVGEDGLFLTLDVGHANTCGHIMDYIKELEDSIHHIHLHDNDGRDDLHRGIGSGNIDFRRVIEALKKIVNKSSIVIEVQSEQELFDSKTKLEAMLERVV